MKTLIFDGADKNDTALNTANQVVREYFVNKDSAVNVYTLRDLNIYPCCGFFSCWLKTPGICVFNDVMREIVECAVQSDYWIFLTPVTFGGYSSELKKAIDRLPPLMLPYFTRVKGEVHHKMRYEKSAHLVVIGSMARQDMENENIFNALVQRNSLNFQNKSAVSKVIFQTDSSKVILNKVMEAINHSG